MPNVATFGTRDGGLAKMVMHLSVLALMWKIQVVEAPLVSFNTACQQ